MNKKGTAFTFALMFLISGCTVFPQVKAEPQTLTVPDDYTTIQSAVNAANQGDRVFVRKGEYYENLIINKSIALVGEEVEHTRITANTKERTNWWPITITCSKVLVTGLSLVDSWGAIDIRGAYGCVVTGNKMLNNHYGVKLSGAYGNTISANYMETTKPSSVGIDLMDSSNNIIIGNKITKFPVGVLIDDVSGSSIVTKSKNNRFLKNVISDCDEAVSLRLTQENILAGNTFSDCKVGLSLCWSDNNVIYHNNFVHNQQQVSSGLKPIWTGSSEERYSVCQWDNGTEGNYWEDYYTGKNANEKTAYHIDENNTDRYPLTDKYPTPAFAFPSLEPSFPFATPTSIPAQPIDPTKPQTIQIEQIAAIFSCIATAAVGLLVFSRKYKQRRVSP